MSNGVGAMRFGGVLVVLAGTCGIADPGEPRLLFRVMNEDGWGYIDQSGQVLVEPRFDRASGSAATRVTAHDEKGWATIEAKPGKDGVVVTPLGCDRHAFGVHEIGGGMYRVLKLRYDGLTLEIYDPEGRFRVEHDKAWGFGRFHEGRLPIQRDGKWGVVDREGRVVVKPTYDLVDNFFEGKAAVMLGKKWGFIDREGKLIIEPRFLLAGEFFEGCAAVGDHRGQWCQWFIKADGTPAFDGRFTYASRFSEGLACVSDSTATDKRFGYVDHSGSFVISPKYARARDFSEGLAAVKYTSDPAEGAGKVAGYINSKSRLVIEVPGAEDLYSFRGGLALVRTTQWMGYINKDGRTVWKTSDAWEVPFDEQE